MQRFTDKGAFIRNQTQTVHETKGPSEVQTKNDQGANLTFKETVTRNTDWGSQQTEQKEKHTALTTHNSRQWNRACTWISTDIHRKFQQGADMGQLQITHGCRKSQ